MNFKLIYLILSLVLIVACSEQEEQTAASSAEASGEPEVVANEEPVAVENPFFQESPLYKNYPQFDLVANEHYLPAFERGMEENLAEIEAIASQNEEATFENTIIQMELSGDLLNRVATVFFAMSSAHTNDDIQEIDRQLASELAAHQDAILLNRDLFARINTLYQQREDLGLEAESIRLLEDYYIDFVRAGASLTAERQQRM